MSDDLIERLEKRHFVPGYEHKIELKRDPDKLKAAARIRELEAEVERLRNPPEEHCDKCGAPRSNHPYRHIFVPAALSETKGE